jgi:hypothetical protein
MRAFTAAVERASEDSVHLTSVDFSAVEEWASLIDRRGHWAVGTIPSSGMGRIQCLGALAWYGLAPESGEPRRVWVGPRLLLDAGERQAFIPDEIPQIATTCPVGWHDWMKPDDTHLGAFAFTARWMRDVRRWVPNLRPAVSVAVNASDAPPPAPPHPALPRSSASAPKPVAGGSQRPEGAFSGVTPSIEPLRADSVAVAAVHDSLSATTARPEPETAVLRAGLGPVTK